jgi:glycosyltransferase involved in cell wall biosynthesis
MRESHRLGENRTITALSGVKGDTRRYRVFHLFEQVQLFGVGANLLHVTDRNLIRRVAHSTLVILHRASYDRYLDKLFNSIRDQDILAISDVDDLIFDPTAFYWIDSPDFQDPFRETLYKEDMRRYRLAMQHCNAALVSTQFLGEQVRPMGLPVWTHRNAFSFELLDISKSARQNKPANKSKVVIGYASGTPTHDRDFAIAKPALKSILHAYPQCELHLYGPLDPGGDWGTTEGRVKRYPLVPWRELPNRLASFDINIAPLVMDNPFGKSKSEIKYIEAGLVSVPTVASTTRAYQYAIQSGVNGFLASDDTEWEQALSQLVEREETRREMGFKAYTDVMKRYHPITRAKELLVTLNQIYQQVKGAPLWPDVDEKMARLNDLDNRLEWKRFYIDPKIEMKPTLLQRGWYSLRYRGVRTLAIQCYIFIRRLLVPWFPFRR